MKLIGLTGGIASGKSTIARRLARHGAVHLDADQMARDAVAPGTEALSQIAARFGANVLTPEGDLDRPALGKIVFHDPEALADLNAIVHPAVAALTRATLEQLAKEQPAGIVVYDVPLLVEAKVNYGWDLVVVADASEEIRTQRLMSRRGMSAEDAAARIRHQATDEERRAVADVIIDTSGSLEQTLAQADQLWEELSAPSAAGEASQLKGAHGRDAAVNQQREWGENPGGS